MAESNPKTDRIKAIKKELIKCNFEQAVTLQTEGGLDANEVNFIVNTVFAELMSRKKFEKAIAVGKHFNLPYEKIWDVTVKNFSALFASGEYEKAAKWGLDNKLESSKILKVAVKLFEKALREKNIPLALQIKEKYTIPNDTLKTITLQGFNAAYQRGDYYNAATLAKYFDFPQKRLIKILIKGIEDAIKKQNINRIIEFEKKFDFLGSSTFDEMQEIEAEKFIMFFKERVLEANKNNPEVIIKIMDKTGFLSRPHRNKFLSDLAASILSYLSLVHSKYLDNNQIDKAIALVKKFELFNDDISGNVREKIVQTAVKYHDKLLEGYDYAKAKGVKEKYSELFKTSIFYDDSTSKGAPLKFFEQALKRGDINVAVKMAKDYNFPKKQIQKPASEALISALEKNNFDEANEILKTFTLNPADAAIEKAARNQFDRAMQNNLYELAADLGYHFKLDKHSTKDAAFQTWQKYLRSGRYDQALTLHKRHRFQKKILQPIVQEVYEYNMNMGLTDRAQKMRKDYRVQVGFWNLIIEFLHKIRLLN